jgi:cytochrome c
LRQSGIVWSPAELDRWLADPAGFLPGTTMAFTGYQSAADRSALIAYLVTATGGGRPAAGD